MLLNGTEDLGVQKTIDVFSKIVHNLVKERLGS